MIFIFVFLRLKKENENNNYILILKPVLFKNYKAIKKLANEIKSN